MTKNEFADIIEHGDDITFQVNGKKLAIFTWMDEGIAIVEQGADKKPEFFLNADNLIAEYKIGNTSLASLIDRVKVSDYTRVS